MQKKIYTLVCVDCSKIRASRHDTQAVRCISCSRKHNMKIMGQSNKKEEEHKKKYHHFCATCSSVVVAGTNRVSCYCKNCSKQFSHKAKVLKKWIFDMTTMQFVCIRIAQSPQVAKCEACKKDEVLNKMQLCKTCAIARKSSLEKTLAQLRELEAEKQQRIREIKKKSREKMKKATVVVGVDGKQKVKLVQRERKTNINTDRDMIEAWLSKNEVKREETRCCTL